MSEQSPLVMKCTNCGASVTGPYCAECGQKRFTAQSLSARSFVNDAMKEFLSVDNKFFRSILPLLFRPGVLTQAYISGRQRRYIKPLSLFVFVNLFFFFVGYRIGLLNWSIAQDGKAAEMINERAAQKGIDHAEFSRSLNEVFRNYQRSMFFGVIPLFAVAMKIILFRRKSTIIEHLVYSIHCHSSFLVMLPVGLLTAIFIFGLFDTLIGTHIAQWIGNEPGLGYFALLIIFLYHFFALQRLYAGSRWRSAIEAGILSIALILIMIPLGQILLFWLVWFTAA